MIRTSQHVHVLGPRSRNSSAFANWQPGQVHNAISPSSLLCRNTRYSLARTISNSFICRSYVSSLSGASSFSTTSTPSPSSSSSSSSSTSRNRRGTAPQPSSSLSHNLVLSSLSKSAAAIIRGPPEVSLRRGEACVLALEMLRDAAASKGIPFRRLEQSVEVAQLLDAISFTFDKWGIEAWDAKYLSRVASSLSQFTKAYALPLQQQRFFNSPRVRRCLRHVTLAFTPQLDRVPPAYLADLLSALARSGIQYEPIFQAGASWLVAAEVAAAAAAQVEQQQRESQRQEEEEEQQQQQHTTTTTTTNGITLTTPASFWNHCDPDSKWRKRANAKYSNRMGSTLAPLDGTPITVLVNLLWAFSKMSFANNNHNNNSSSTSRSAASSGKDVSGGAGAGTREAIFPSLVMSSSASVTYAPLYAVILRRILTSPEGGPLAIVSTTSSTTTATTSTPLILSSSSSPLLSPALSSSSPLLATSTSTMSLHTRAAATPIAPASIVPYDYTWWRRKSTSQAPSSSSSVPMNSNQNQQDQNSHHNNNQVLLATKLLSSLSSISGMYTIIDKQLLTALCPMQKDEENSSSVAASISSSSSYSSLSSYDLAQLSAIAAAHSLNILRCASSSPASSNSSAPSDDLQLSTRHTSSSIRAIIDLGLQDTPIGYTTLQLLLDRMRRLLSLQEVPDIGTDAAHTLSSISTLPNNNNPTSNTVINGSKNTPYSAFSPGELATALGALATSMRHSTFYDDDHHQHGKARMRGIKQSDFSQVHVSVLGKEDVSSISASSSPLASSAAYISQVRILFALSRDTILANLMHMSPSTLIHVCCAFVGAKLTLGVPLTAALARVVTAAISDDDVSRIAQGGSSTPIFFSSNKNRSNRNNDGIPMRVTSTGDSLALSSSSLSQTTPSSEKVSLDTSLLVDAAWALAFGVNSWEASTPVLTQPTGMQLSSSSLFSTSSSSFHASSLSSASSPTFLFPEPAATFMSNTTPFLPRALQQQMNPTNAPWGGPIVLHASEASPWHASSSYLSSMMSNIQTPILRLRSQAISAEAPSSSSMSSSSPQPKPRIRLSSSSSSSWSQRSSSFTVGVGSTAVSMVSPLGILCRIADTLTPNVLDMSPRQISSFLVSLAVSGVYHAPFLSACCERLLAPLVIKQEGTSANTLSSSPSFSNEISSQWPIHLQQQVALAAALFAARPAPLENTGKGSFLDGSLDEQQRKNQKQPQYRWNRAALDLLHASTSWRWMMMKKTKQSREDSEDATSTAPNITIPFQVASNLVNGIIATTFLLDKRGTDYLLAITPSSSGNNIEVDDDNNDDNKSHAISQLISQSSKGISIYELENQYQISNSTSATSIIDQKHLSSSSSSSKSTSKYNTPSNLRMRQQLDSLLQQELGNNSNNNAQSTTSTTTLEILHNFTACNGLISFPLAIPALKLVLSMDEQLLEQQQQHHNDDSNDENEKANDGGDASLSTASAVNTGENGAQYRATGTPASTITAAAYMRWQSHIMMSAGWKVVPMSTVAFLGASGGMRGKLRYLMRLGLFDKKG